MENYVFGGIIELFNLNPANSLLVIEWPNFLKGPDAQARVDRATEWAKDEEAKASALQRKVVESSKKGLKKYAELLEKAEEQRGAVSSRS